MLSGASGAADVCGINVGEACEFTVGTQKLAESMPIGCDADNRELASAQPLSERTHLQAGGYPIQTGANNVLSLGLVEQLVIHAWIDRDVLISRTQVSHKLAGRRYGCQYIFLTVQQ